jgi:hypothetical protein
MFGGPARTTLPDKRPFKCHLKSKYLNEFFCNYKQQSKFSISASLRMYVVRYRQGWRHSSFRKELILQIWQEHALKRRHDMKPKRLRKLLGSRNGWLGIYDNRVKGKDVRHLRAVTI